MQLVVQIPVQGRSYPAWIGGLQRQAVLQITRGSCSSSAVWYTVCPCYAVGCGDAHLGTVQGILGRIERNGHVREISIRSIHSYISVKPVCTTRTDETQRYHRYNINGDLHFLFVPRPQNI